MSPDTYKYNPEIISLTDAIIIENTHFFSVEKLASGSEVINFGIDDVTNDLNASSDNYRAAKSFEKLILGVEAMENSNSALTVYFKKLGEILRILLGKNKIILVLSEI